MTRSSFSPFAFREGVMCDKWLLHKKYGEMFMNEEQKSVMKPADHRITLVVGKSFSLKLSYFWPLK